MSVLGFQNLGNIKYSQNVSFARREESAKNTENQPTKVEKITNVIDQEVKNKSNKVAFAVGGSVLGVTAVATLLNPKTFNKFVPKLRTWAQQAKIFKKQNHQGIVLRGWYDKVVKAFEKSATVLEVGNNLNSAKDIFFKKLCTERRTYDWIKREKTQKLMQGANKAFTKVGKRTYNVITKFFDNISKRTVLSNYQRAGKRMNALENLINQYAEKLPAQEKKILQEKLVKLAKSRENFTAEKISLRLVEQEKMMSELEEKTIQKLKSYLKETSEASKNYKTGGKEQLRESIKDTTNFWAKDIVQSQKDVVVKKGQAMTEELVGEQGLYDEIIEVLSPNITSKEKAVLEKAYKKVKKNLRKANNNECVEYFDKKRDLILGSAPTDLLSNLGVLALSGVLIGATKEKEDKVSRTLTMVFPAIAGVGTSLVMTAKLYSGIRGIIVGALTGAGFSLAGSVTNKKYLKAVNKEPLEELSGVDNKKEQKHV